MITKQFVKKIHFTSFDFKKVSIHGLAFSQYMDDPSVTEEHKKLTKATSKIILRRVGSVLPSDILKNPAHLLFFMREDYIEQ